MTVYPGGQVSKAKMLAIQTVIYHQSSLLAAGNKLAAEKTYPQLDVRFHHPSSLTGQYPVADEAAANPEQVNWSYFDMVLRKGQVYYTIPDATEIRAVQNTTNAINAKRAGEAMAEQKDKNMLSVLYAGAGDTVAVNAAWSSPSADIEDDIIRAYQTIVDQSNINNAELNNMVCIVPTAVYGYVKQATSHGGVRTTIEENLKNTLGVDIVPSRDSTTMTTVAFMGVAGEDTAIHGVLKHPKAKAVEVDRIAGVGEKYVVTQWFNTHIVEDGSGTDVTDRICSITGVA